LYFIFQLQPLLYIERAQKKIYCKIKGEKAFSFLPPNKQHRKYYRFSIFPAAFYSSFFSSFRNRGKKEKKKFLLCSFWLPELKLFETGMVFDGRDGVTSCRLHIN
jgi:hypothetical protein